MKYKLSYKNELPEKFTAIFTCFSPEIVDILYLRGEITEWCDEHNIQYSVRPGLLTSNTIDMQVILLDVESALAFKLRW